MERSNPPLFGNRSFFAAALLFALVGLWSAAPTLAQSAAEATDVGSPDADQPSETAEKVPEAKSLPKSVGLLSTTAVSQVSSVTPTYSAAAGGGLAIVRGNFFQAGAAVKVGGVTSAGPVFRSATQINIAVPALSAGTLNDLMVTNPNGSVGVLPEAVFADFLDVPIGHPYHDYVEQLVRLKVTAGVGGGNYGVNNGVTRAQMAVFLLKAKFGPSYVPPAAKGTIFTDVPIGSFAAAYIEQLSALGITGGCAPSQFCPASPITVEQMAVFLLRGTHGTTYTPQAAVGAFSDLPAASPFAPWAEQLNREGIYGGVSAGVFGTGTTTTRGLMAAMIVRGFQEADVIRFLQQATWGPNQALIQSVQTSGIRAWLDSQFLIPSGSWPTLTLFPTNTPQTCGAACQRDNYTMFPLQNRFFTKAMYDGDQLRQRVVWALHQILVISGRDIQQPSWVSPYLKILDNNAFGNYRDILYQMTVNPGMGSYLNMATSTKFSPNENYGREINQLFSVGLNEMNPDGTDKLDSFGDPQATYSQTTIDNFALVFTGWFIANASQGTPDYINPMSVNATNHDPGVHILYGGVGIGGGSSTPDQELNAAIDNIFNHKNLGPFVAQNLIHNLVTSNPSPSYVERVSTVFDDDGNGVRGNLQAVVKAILLDPEARGSFKSDPVFGHLKEPAVLMTQVLRAFNAKSANLAGQSDGVLNGQASNMSQDILRPPTVFNYYPADFAVPGSSTLLGPEFGIYTATEALRRANFVNTMVFSTIPVNVGNGIPNGTALDYSAWLPLASNPTALVAELNRVLMYNTMSAQMQSTIITAINAVAATNPSLRIKQAVYLVASSSQFQVQR